MLILNRFIGLIFFLLFLPVYFIIFLTILLFDGFPILFKQDRFGQNNSTFSIYKFRTMKNIIGDIPTHLVGDSKMMLSKTGLLLRKLSFDELGGIIGEEYKNHYISMETSKNSEWSLLEKESIDSKKRQEELDHSSNSLLKVLLNNTSMCRLIAIRVT